MSKTKSNITRVEIVGNVKHDFDQARGYGFIQAADCGKDVYFRPDGYVQRRLLPDGSVTLLSEEMPPVRRGTEVIVLELEDSKNGSRATRWCMPAYDLATDTVYGVMISGSEVQEHAPVADPVLKGWRVTKEVTQKEFLIFVGNYESTAQAYRNCQSLYGSDSVFMLRLPLNMMIDPETVEVMELSDEPQDAVEDTTTNLSLELYVPEEELVS